MSTPLDRASRDASKQVTFCRFQSERANSFEKYSFCEIVPMGETDFVATTGFTIVLVEKRYVGIDRAR